MVVQHNISAMNANRLFGINNSGLAKSLEKLSSGYAINRAGDNAAGLAVSEKMRSQIAGLSQGVKNAQDGISMIQTYEGALTETDSILQRMKTLANQAANGTYQNEVDRDAIQYEFDHLNDELNQIADTDYNGVVVMNGGVMADGLKQVNGKFDYTNSNRNPMQLSSSYVSGLDSQLINTTNTTDKTNANTVWKTVFAGTDRSDISTTNDGPDSFEVTLKYDATATDAAKTWTIDEVTDGADKDQITIAGTGNGGFNLTSGGIKFANVVLDQSKLQNGDTITLKITNPINKIAAPTNGGFTIESNTLTQGSATTAIAKNDADITDFTFDGTNVTDEKMNAALKEALDAMEGLTVAVTYAANGTESVNINGVTLAATAKALGKSANGYGLQAKLDGTTVTLLAKDGTTALATFSIKDDTSTANGTTGTVTSTLHVDAALFDEGAVPTVEVKEPVNGNVSNANAYSQATAPLTYTDHIILQAGARTKDAVDFTFKYTTQGMGDLKANMNVSAREDGLNTANLSLRNQKDANYAIDRIDNAINKVSMVRATFGAVQNRLEHKIDNMNVTKENLTSAESRIRDTNMAEEMTNFTKNQILSQASQAMLAQANQLPQGVLQLLG